jgi:hypothetical protein
MALDSHLRLKLIEGPAAVPLSADPGSAQLLEIASAGTLQDLIDDLPEQIAILDDQFNILAANHAWRDVVTTHGYLNFLPGHNYRAVCVQHAAQGYEPAAEAVAALDGLSSGKHSFWQLIYNGRDRWRGRDFQICFHRINRDDRNFILVTRFDLTEITELRPMKSDFTRAVAQGQANERLRFGRELHDGTSQLLTTIGLLIGRLKGEPLSRQSSALIEELQEVLGQAHQEIRSISYLAHPPSLEKLGLANALKLLVEGFARRTGLEASFELGQSARVSAICKSRSLSSCSGVALEYPSPRASGSDPGSGLLSPFGDPFHHCGRRGRNSSGNACRGREQRRRTCKHAIATGRNWRSPEHSQTRAWHCNYCERTQRRAFVTRPAVQRAWEMPTTA